MMMTSKSKLLPPVPSTIPKWWMQKMHQSAWHHEIVYAVRSSKDDRIFNQTIFGKKKYGGGVWKLEFVRYFVLRRQHMNRST
jgi:hypothetical protein